MLLIIYMLNAQQAFYLLAIMVAHMKFKEIHLLGCLLQNNDILLR